MSNKQTFQLSFISICVGTVMWFLFIITDFINILMYAGWLNDFISVILEFGLSFGLILFAVGILQLYKSAQIPSIILITGSALNFISSTTNFINVSGIFYILTFYFPIIFFLIFILKYNDVKQLKIKIFIAIFGVGIALVGKALFTILIAINPDLLFVGPLYRRTWLASGLNYLMFFGLCGGLLMATGALSTLSEKSPEAIKDISQPMSVSDWLITYLIMIVPIVNIVMLFVWGFGSNTNLSKASWAKATLLWFCIITVIYVLFLIIVFSGI